MKKLIFIGIPGSGKGTQAVILKKHGFVHISTGEVIRKAFKRKDKLIMPYESSIQNEGKLLPDELLFVLLEKAISKVPRNIKGYVLDGAVRTTKQANFIVNHALANTTVYFDFNEKEAEKRLLERGKTSKRADDNLRTIKKRFQTYKKQTKPALKFLKKNTKFIDIDASKSVKEVSMEVLRKLSL